MCRRAGEVKILVLFVTILRTQISNLPEVVTEPKRCTLLEIKSFLPDLSLVYNLELDMLSEILRAHFFGEARQDSFAGAIHERLPILPGARVEMPDRDENIKRVLSLWRGSFVCARRCMDIKRRRFNLHRVWRHRWNTA